MSRKHANGTQKAKHIKQTQRKNKRPTPKED
mgnify:CR=1 FL=1